MTLSGDSDLFLHRPSLPGVMSYVAGQYVRILHSGATGRVFLKLPLREVYLVQFPGFPVIEKIYNGCDLEPLTEDPPMVAAEPVHHHA